MSYPHNSFAAAQAYQTAAVTVPPLKAVILLHHGAVRNLHKLIEAQEARNYEGAHHCLMKATAILRGFSHHLDIERGGALAENLFETYNALILAALRSFGRPGATQSYRRIIESIAELQDAWEFVFRTVPSRGGRP